MATPRRTPRKTPSKTRVSMTPSRLPPRRTPRRMTTPAAMNHDQGGEGIQVAIRMRPLNKNESSRQRIWKDLPQYSSIAQTTSDGKPLPERVTGRTFFTFDKTFGEGSSTLDVYNDTAKNIVSSVMNGLNGTIFAYGQTSSGKTYTMQGSGTIAEGSTGNGGGIVHMAARDIFNHIMSKQDRLFVVQASFLEIYNEEVRDLLCEDHRTLQIREDPRRGVFVQSEEETVTDFNSLLGVLFKGEKSRTFASTAMNERSSRSHTIFRITIESRQKSQDQENQTEGPALVSTLNLVDLAGSESVRHTGATGERQKEGGMINQSLLTLSRVIVALGTANQMHINFRDSKLTRILQPSLSGNARMAVICCATPSELYLEETRSTLQFASRAKLVKTNAQVNEVMDDRSMIRRLQQELAEARRLVDSKGVVTAPSDQVRMLEEKAENAGSDARAAEERLRRLQASILNGGVLFADRKEQDSPVGLNNRKRRYSLGNISPTSLAPVESLDAPNTLPRRKKVHKSHLNTSCTTSQLDLVRDALHARTKLSQSLKEQLNEMSRAIKSKDSEMVALSCSNDILRSERDSTKGEAVELAEKLATLSAKMEATVALYEKEVTSKSKELEGALARLDDELGDRKDLEEALDSLQEEKALKQKSHNLELENMCREHKEEKARILDRLAVEKQEEFDLLQQQHDSEMKSQQELANIITEENSNIKDQYACLTEERDALLQTAEEQSSEIQSFQDELCEARKVQTKLTDQLQQTQKEITTLTADLEENKSVLDLSNQHMKSLKTEIDAKDQTLTSTVEQRDELLETVDRLKGQCSEKVECYEILQSEFGELKKTSSDLSTELATAVTELAAERASHGATAENLERVKNELLATREKLDQKVFELDSETNSFVEQQTQLQRACKDEIEKNEELKKTCIAWETKATELSSNINVLHQERDSIEAELTTTSAALEKAQEEVTRKKTTLESLQRDASDINSTKETLEEELKNRLDELTALKSALQSEKDHLKESKVSYDNLARELQDIKSEKLALNEEVNKKIKVISVLQEAVQTNNEEIEALRVQASASDDDLESLRTELTHEIEKSANLRDKLNSASSEIQSLTDENENLGKKMLQVTSDLNHSQVKSTGLAVVVQNTQKSWETSLSRLDQAKSENRDLHERLKKAADVETSLTENLRAAHSRVSELHRTVESKTLQTVGLAITLQRVQSQLEDKCLYLKESSEKLKMTTERESADSHSIAIELDESRAITESLRLELADVQQKLPLLVEEKNSLEQNLYTERKKHEEISAEFEALKARLSSTESSYSDRVKELESEIDLREAQKLEVETKVANLQKDLQRESSRCEELGGELTLNKAEMSSSEKAYVDRVQQLESQIKLQYQAQDDLKQTALASEVQLKSDNEKLSSEKNELSRRLVEMAEAVTTLEANFDANCRLVETLQQEINKLEPKPSRSLLFLFSGQSISRDVASKQERARAMLKSVGIVPTEVDGAQECNRAERSSLFEISGLGPRYPQLFLVDDSSTEFWGDWERLESMNENGILKDDLRSKMGWKSALEFQKDAELAAEKVLKLEALLQQSETESKERGDELLKLHDMLEESEKRVSQAKLELNNLEDELESKENMLSQSAASRDDECMRLREELGRMTKTVETLERESREVRESVSASLQAENHELKSLLLSSNQSMEESRATIATLQAKLRQNEETLLRVKNTLEDERRQRSGTSSSDKDVESLELENTQLKRQIDDYLGSRATFEEEQKRIRGDEQRLLIREAEEEMEKLRVENINLRKSSAKTEVEAYTARANSDELRDELKEKMQEVIQIESKLAAYENENARLKRSARRHESEIDSEKTKLAQELETTKSDLAQAKSMITKLHDVEKEKSALVQELQSVMATMSRLDVPSLEKEKRDLTSELSRLKAELMRKESAENSSFDSVKSLQRQLAEYKIEMDAKDERIRKLSAVKLTKDQVAALKKLKADNIEYKKQLAESQEEVKQLRQQHSVAPGDQSEIAKLRFGMEALESKLRKYATHCQRLEEEKAEISNVLRSSNCMEGDDIPKAVVRVCDQLASLEETCNTLSKSENQASSFLLEVESLRTHNSSLQGQIQEMRRKSDRLVRSEIQLKEQLASATARYDESKAVKSSETRDADEEKTRQIRYLEQENLQLMKDLKGAKKQVQHLKAEANVLRQSTVRDASHNPDLASINSSDTRSKKRSRHTTPNDKENGQVQNTRNSSFTKSSAKRGRTLPLSSRKERKTPGLGEAFADTPENTQECKQS